MKRLAILLLCFLPTLVHANLILWETFARAHAPMVIAFFQDYYAQKDAGAIEGGAAISAEDEDILLVDELEGYLEPVCLVDEDVAEEDSGEL